MLVSTGLLVSFDYEYSLYAIPAIYSRSNSITLAISKDRVTWTGEQFEIPASFFEKVKQLDTDNKILIYEYSLDYTLYSPMECETLVRNMLGKEMSKADWYIQIDTDEYFLDYGSFIDDLAKIVLKPDEKVTVYGKLIPMFKSDQDGFYIVNTYENGAIATNDPVYSLARRNTGNTEIYFENYLLHQSWDREEYEIAQKIRNWGHKTDFDADAYFKFWLSINPYNYKYITNFHPIWPAEWPNFTYVKGSKLTQLRNYYVNKITDEQRIRQLAIQEAEAIANKEKEAVRQSSVVVSKAKRVLRQLLPPIIFTIIKYLK